MKIEIYKSKGWNNQVDILPSIVTDFKDKHFGVQFAWGVWYFGLIFIW